MLIDFEELRDDATSMQEEGELLYAFVRALKPKLALEIGTRQGFTALYIGTALRENGFGHLITCDAEDYGQRKNIKRNELDKYVLATIESGATIKTSDKIDFAFIDGSHETEDVKKDIENVFPQLNDKATVIFHDAVGPKDEYVLRALTELNIPYTLIPTHYGMAIYYHHE